MILHHLTGLNILWKNYPRICFAVMLQRPGPSSMKYLQINKKKLKSWCVKDDVLRYLGCNIISLYKVSYFIIIYIFFNYLSIFFYNFIYFNPCKSWLLYMFLWKNKCCLRILLPFHILIFCTCAETTRTVLNKLRWDIP